MCLTNGCHFFVKLIYQDKDSLRSYRLLSSVFCIKIIHLFFWEGVECFANQILPYVPGQSTSFFKAAYLVPVRIFEERQQQLSKKWHFDLSRCISYSQSCWSSHPCLLNFTATMLPLSPDITSFYSKNLAKASNPKIKEKRGIKIL